MIFVWNSWWHWWFDSFQRYFTFMTDLSAWDFLFFSHKRDDWREWKDHFYQNNLKMINFILTEVINVSHSPLRHEFLDNFRIKCQKRCYIRNCVWISLRYSRHSMLMNSFLIKIGILQRMVAYELQIRRKEQSSWLLFCYIFPIVEYMNELSLSSNLSC